MIRWIALASQSDSRTNLVFQGTPGRDIESMAECMEKMGSSIEREHQRWAIRGKRGGLDLPVSTLNCGNSATTANFVSAIAACMNGSVEIDGDQSLRKRDLSPMASTLRELGCEVSADHLPYTVSGPVCKGHSNIDESFSSQTLSGIILASPAFPGEVRISLRGKAVSRWYRNLTIEYSILSGWNGHYETHWLQPTTDVVSLSPWVVETPEIIEIPEETSLLPIPLLFDRLHETESLDYSKFKGSPVGVSLEQAISETPGKVSLRDTSDVISPLAALMAMGNGGEIVEAAHARGKESNRIASTIRMLSSFGIEMEERTDGLSIPGGQHPMEPSEEIDCEHDHRLAMTAAVLATKVGAKLSGHEICDVTHPGFLEMISPELAET
jgi:3-phosphoshikimate 1-carboxyvinyltransferase